MIRTVTDFISAIQVDLSKWGSDIKPWFRGESGNHPHLCPKIVSYEHYKENYLLQSFRRQAGGLGNVPPREHIDEWLFLAQHYGVPTRLLDWTEGALHALYFAINRGQANFRVYMLNPRKLNNEAGTITYDLNYPLSFGDTFGALYIANAWQNRQLIQKIRKDIEKQIRDHPRQNHSPEETKERLESMQRILKIPIAFPAIYQDRRMISQRSCFTIHGEDLKPIREILSENNIDESECLVEYNIDVQNRKAMMQQLNILGISAAAIFPDLDHLAEDLRFDINGL